MKLPLNHLLHFMLPNAVCILVEMSFSAVNSFWLVRLGSGCGGAAIYYKNGNEPCGPQNAGYFLTSRGTVSFSRNTLLNVVRCVFRKYRKQPYYTDSAFPMFVNREHRQVHLALHPAPALAAVSVWLRHSARARSSLVIRVLMSSYMAIGQHHAMTDFTPNGSSKL